MNIFRGCVGGVSYLAKVLPGMSVKKEYFEKTIEIIGYFILSVLFQCPDLPAVRVRYKTKAPV